MGVTILLVNLGKAKTILYVFLCLIIFSSTALALKEEKHVSLEEIVELVLEKDINLKLAALDLEDAKIEHTKSQLSNLFSNSRLVELQSELQMIQAEENYCNYKAGVILDVMTEYMEMCSINQKITTAEKEKYLEKKIFEEIEAQVKVGYKGSLELFEHEINQLIAVNILENYKDDMEDRFRKLKQQLDSGKEYVIKIIEIKKPDLWFVSKEDAYNAALTSRVLEIRERQVEVVKSDIEKAKISGLPTLDLQKKEVALKRAQLQLEKENQNLENAFKDAYFRYEQAIKNMDMAERTLIQYEDHLKIVSEQRAAGLVSNNDFLFAELNMYKAKDELTSSIIDYHVSKLVLQRVMGVELEVDFY